MAETAGRCPCCGQAVAAAADRLLLDTVGNVAIWRGRMVKLRPREMDVLYVLHRHAPEVVQRERMVVEVYGHYEAGRLENPLGALKVHISNLRKKLVALEGVRIVAEWGGGWRLVVGIEGLEEDGCS